MGAASHRYHALDALRGVAALIVVLFHCCAALLGRRVIDHGDLAVDFFFILSGFVLAHAYQEKIRSRRLGLAGLALARIVRLHPLIVFGVLLGIIAAYVARHPTLGDTLKAVAFGLGPLPARARSVGFGSFPVNPPTWSLFFEYLASFSLIFIARAPSALLALVAFIAAAIMIGWSIAAGSFIGINSQILFGAVRVSFAFPAGVLIYRWQNHFPRLKLPAWVLAVAVCALASVPVIGAADVLIALVGFPLVVALGAQAEVRSRVWRLSGDLSYPIYSVHYPLVVVVAALSPIGWRLPMIPICTAAAVLAAWLALRFYDEPARRWMRLWSVARHPGDVARGSAPTA